ncbi:hypothetical protein PENSPDRAFT_581680 [Peniophora sp. CONT]|nr:hypothetical protein PENSPDRAFT_581680 [Peniophora sp. CONT]
MDVLHVDLQFHGRFAALSWIDAVSGSQHAPTWTCTCRIDGLAISTGTGTHKHLARNEAADKAFEILRQK